ncbi:fasciclin domain-containing protein [Halopseudomonas nanhaiensis]|uniref:fasciclin domain-containing protein n=1 Tax=Halopseudomonas nanhaiensis TaxID=2830842 RepID=UPI001CBBA46D|nr:fasciclin domain-containing protein [Halopseudomonas nanhaiensis]UAW98305.1 fasciclin domain-containing protein [Halopseudomonas nanhaiensis]
MFVQRIAAFNSTVLASLFAAGLMVSAPAMAHNHGEHADKPDADIIETAREAGQFDTLLTAVKEAGLEETLKGAGPFTVFAPTDEAFEKIPDSDLEALLADKEKLTDVLTYHVVSGKVMAEDVAGMSSAPTVQGESLSIDASDGVKVDDAKVVKADVKASNGVIHVIDTVLMPGM